MEIVNTKIMPNGKIKLPPKILKGWGVKAGRDIKMRIKDQQVILFPAKSSDKSKDSLRKVLEDLRKPAVKCGIEKMMLDEVKEE
ncbi:MAG: hypothetical protein AB1567_08300 [bacterium]